jgi:cytochrome c5
MLARTAIWLVLTVAVVAQEIPEGEGKKLLEQRCATCHDLKPVVSLKQSRPEWKDLVVKMRGYGAAVDDKEADVLTEYLTKHFGPAPVKPDTPEEKTAKRLVDGICSSCHDGGLVRSTKATKAEWRDIVMRMNGLDAGVSLRDVDVLVDYLASKYGR